MERSLNAFMMKRAAGAVGTECESVASARMGTHSEEERERQGKGKRLHSRRGHSSIESDGAGQRKVFSNVHDEIFDGWRVLKISLWASRFPVS